MQASIDTIPANLIFDKLKHYTSDDSECLSRGGEKYHLLKKRILKAEYKSSAEYESLSNKD